MLLRHWTQVLSSEQTLGISEPKFSVFDVSDILCWSFREFHVCFGVFEAYIWKLLESLCSCSLHRVDIGLARVSIWYFRSEFRRFDVSMSCPQFVDQCRSCYRRKFVLYCDNLLLLMRPKFLEAIEAMPSWLKILWLKLAIA